MSGTKLSDGSQENKKKRTIAAGLAAIALAGSIGAGATYALWSEDNNLGGIPGRFTYGVFEAGLSTSTLVSPSTPNEALTVSLPKDKTTNAQHGTNIMVPVVINAKGQGNVDVSWNISNSSNNVSGVFEDATANVYEVAAGVSCDAVSFAEPPVATGKLNALSSSSRLLLEAAKGENAPTGPTSTQYASRTLCVNISIPEYVPPVKQVTVQAESDLGTATDQATATSEATPISGGNASITFNWGTTVHPYATPTPTETATGSSQPTSMPLPEENPTSDASPSSESTSTEVSPPAEQTSASDSPIVEPSSSNVEPAPDSVPAPTASASAE